jgi:alpha-tubulin suppressor-like RCC1 family protein
VLKVSAGGSFTCAVTTAGAVYCWGHNQNGECGVDTGGADVTTPTALATLTQDVDEVTTSNFVTHACARKKTDESLWCWGDNSFGELGQAAAASGPTPVLVGGDVDGGALTGVDSFVCGDAFTCAVTSDGKAWCWGIAYSGVLSTVTSGYDGQPLQIPGLPPMASITGRDTHVCALARDGSVWCWGRNGYGELGNGLSDTSADGGTTCVSDPCYPTPQEVLGGLVAIDVSANLHYTLARKADGTLWGWGANDSAQLGHAPGTGGDATCKGVACQLLPVQIPGL